MSHGHKRTSALEPTLLSPVAPAPSPPPAATPPGPAAATTAPAAAATAGAVPGAGAEVTSASAEGPADPLVGTRLKHFEIIRLLGRGGMGSVYLATDTALERPVAVKVLASEIAHDPEVVARFMREARTQARVRHPNVAQIYF